MRVDTCTSLMCSPHKTPGPPADVLDMFNTQVLGLYVHGCFDRNCSHMATAYLHNPVSCAICEYNKHVITFCLCVTGEGDEETSMQLLMTLPYLPLPP